MAQLAEALAQLANISTIQLTNSLVSTKTVMQPTPFLGEHGDNACHFLTAFTLWGMAQESGLNVVDAQGNTLRHCDTEWICMALSFLQEDAAVWAALAMEDFTNRMPPFDGHWETFCEQFKVCFKSANKMVDAKEKLWVYGRKA